MRLLGGEALIDGCLYGGDAREEVGAVGGQGGLVRGEGSDGALNFGGFGGLGGEEVVVRLGFLVQDGEGVGFEAVILCSRA